MQAPLYIVAIGGSAGSLKALTDFFDYTPQDHVSYVILRHMPEDYHSQLKAILKQHSKLQLVDVKSDTPILPNTVYIAPADKNLILKDGNLQMLDKTLNGPNLCVDRFFQSLSSQAMGKRAIAIVLSGSGFDGAKGVCYIKKTGGLVIVQEPQTCQFKYMPQHAIESGCVDYIAAPSHMPRIIRNYIRSLDLDKASL